jgi:hypothetical protein
MTFTGQLQRPVNVMFYMDIKAIVRNFKEDIASMQNKTWQIQGLFLHFSFAKHQEKHLTL